MSKIAGFFVTIVALIHTYIAYFEIFAWTTLGPKNFPSFPADLFEQTTSMAANQGIYNSFLAAGLIWSLFIRDVKWQRNVATCFLLFVAIAGIFGAITVDTKTIFVQVIPACVGLASVWFLKARSA